MGRLRELLESAKNEVVICTTASDFEDKSRIFVPALDRLAKNNVRVKLALSGDSDNIKKVASKINVKFKTADTNARFFIADKKEVIFMVTPEQAEEEMGVWLNSEFFTSSLTSIIDFSLKNGNTLPTAK
jgi:sugar-specific transcriptional regulator TrmB